MKDLQRLMLLLVVFISYYLSKAPSGSSFHFLAVYIDSFESLHRYSKPDLVKVF